MGEVHVGRDTRLDRRVAIKVLPAHLHGDPVARERLKREALAAAALDHPFICKVFEAGETDGVSFIAMEFVDGETLHTRLLQGALPIPEALRIVGEIADALEAAHASRLIHRDLKPANVMLTKQGRVKVMDFGLARQVVESGAAATVSGASPALTESGMRVGTPDYMSPEQALGQPLDERSDLFALGIVVAQMLTGSHPFRRSSQGATVAAIVREPPLFEAGDTPLPPPLLSMLRRLLAKDLEERYQSVTDLKRDLGTLSGTLAGSAVSPVAATGRGSTRLPLVGRDAERAELVRGLDAAIAGTGSVVMIAGEPGIGKTRLTADVLAEARRRGVFCLVGHCYEMEGAPPYIPFIEMLEYSAREVPPSAFRLALGDAASGVSHLMPELRRQFTDIAEPPELPPEQQRRFLFNAYLEFVERSCRTAPISVILEDLHWADEPTLMLLQHVVARVPALRLFLMGTYRDVELDVGRPFARTLEILLRERRATRIALRRLPLESVETMLASMSGHTPPPSLARLIFEGTEGNPFFVEEVFQHLSEEGKLFDTTGAWRGDLRAGTLDVPEGVRLVVGRRLERLGTAPRRILATAAVIGRTFSLQLLERIEADPDAVLEAIEGAEHAQLLVAEAAGRDPRYRFAHELIRQTLADGLSLPRRQRLHLRIADAVESTAGTNIERHASALAHHLYQAGAAADPDRATKYLLMAARHARAAAAFEEALAHLDNALSLCEGERSATVAELMFERAGVQLALNMFEEGIAEYGRAVDMYDALGETERMAWTGYWLCVASIWHGRHENVPAVMERVLGRLGSAEPALRCRLLAVSATSNTACGLYTQQGLDALPEIDALQASIPDDVTTRDYMIRMKAFIHFQAGDVQRGGDFARAAAVSARRRGALWEAVGVEWMAAACDALQGRSSEARALALELSKDAPRAGHNVVSWIARWQLASLDIMQTAFDAAEANIRASMAERTTTATTWRFLDHRLLGLIEHFRGRDDAALANLRTAVSIERPSMWLHQSKALLFFLSARAGDRSALALLDESIPALPLGARAATIGAWLALPHYVKGCALLGEWQRAAALREPLEIWCGRAVTCDHSMAATAAGIAAASAGDWAAAEHHHRTAVEQADALGLRLAQADAREWQGRTLLMRDAPADRARADALLAEAAERYETCGMATFAADSTRASS